MCSTQKNEKGFTLIEMMVTLVIALVILAGMTAVFISQTRAAHTVASKTETMGDLYLASQIMQSALRGAKAVCWDSVNSRLIYQPIDSAVDITSAACTTDPANGWFKYSGTAICWDRALDAGGCQELLRGIASVSGLTVTPSSNADLQTVRTITFSSIYKGSDHVDRTLGLKFKIWPRNRQ